MGPRITKEVLEVHLNCRLKGHLRQIGECGLCSDYEAMTSEFSLEARRQIVDRIMASHTTSEVATGIPADESQLKRGLLFILDATLEDAFIFIRFDGLKRVEGPSKIGDYHYVPMLFQGGRSNRREQRLLLSMRLAFRTSAGPIAELRSYLAWPCEPYRESLPETRTA